MLGSIRYTHWFLGQAGVLLEHLGNAGFELQIVDVPHLQEYFVNSDGLFFEVQHGA